MELAKAVRELLRRPWLLALGALVATVAAILSVYHIENGKLKSRSLVYSAASTQVLVDAKSSLFSNAAQPFEQLANRAQAFAQVMVSPEFLSAVGSQVGLSGSQIYAAGPVKVNVPRTVIEPTDLRRNVQIAGETKPYRLSFEALQELPTITINSQAPTTAQAIALANASAVALKRYVANLEASTGAKGGSQVVIRQLGTATGGVVDGGASKTLAALVFIAVFALWCVGMLYASRFRRNWRASAAAGDGENEPGLDNVVDEPRLVGHDGELAPIKGHEELEPVNGNGHDALEPAAMMGSREHGERPVPARGLR